MSHVLLKRRNVRSVTRTPLAVTLDGRIIVGVHQVELSADPKRLVALARSLGRGRVFVGLELKSREQATVLQWLCEAAHESTAHILGQRLRRAKLRMRRSKAT